MEAYPEASYNKHKKAAMCKHCKSVSHSTARHMKHKKEDESKEARMGKHFKMFTPSVNGMGTESEVGPNYTTRGNNFRGSTTPGKVALGGIGRSVRVANSNRGDEPSLTKWTPPTIHKKGIGGGFKGNVKKK